MLPFLQVSAIGVREDDGQDFCFQNPWYLFLGTTSAIIISNIIVTINNFMAKEPSFCPLFLKNTKIVFHRFVLLNFVNVNFADHFKLQTFDIADPFD